MDATGYSGGMSNIQPDSTPTPEALMRSRGAVLGRLLDEERWSNRAAAQRLGLSHTYIGNRVNGEVDITFSDVEAFARLLKMQPGELFLKLLHLDSNQEPIGSQSALVTLLSDRPRKERKSIPRVPAIVSQMHG